MYKLRDYQQQAVEAAVNFFSQKKKINGLMVLPTGSGKSLVIANIAHRLNSPVLIFQPSKEILEQLLIAGRTSILVFTRFIEEAQHLVSKLGSKAVVVSSNTGKDDRERYLREFKSGKINVIANVGVLTTGFDFPALSTVVLARPTMSLALYYQMCGRAIRQHKDKVSWIVDLCGNYKRFGRVEELQIKEIKPAIWAVFSGKKQLTNVYFNKK